MTDASVATALRSGTGLVVIEAPAGCGKTYQAAEYAREAAGLLPSGQKILILTHTHAACSVFSMRTAGVGSRVQIGTIDSLITQIGTAYHRALELPRDVSAWAFAQGDSGFDQLACKVCSLLRKSDAISGALVKRYPVVICDEHQDASEAQHGMIMALSAAGARLLIFADPMQAIYGTDRERAAQLQRWTDLQRAADITEALDRPHRWANGSLELGEWILDARTTLQQGGSIDLRGRRPDGLAVIEADNEAPRHGNYQIGAQERRQINTVIRRHENLLVLSAHNSTVRGLNAFWGRQIPIWEGFTRSALSKLTLRCRQHMGDPQALAQALCEFVGEVGIGFTPSGFANRLLKEVDTACTVPCRGKPALLQRLAQCLLQSPNHQGVGQALTMLYGFIQNEPVFGGITIDLRREFHEALQLANFDDPEQGLVQLNSRRTKASSVMPKRAISSIHKAKGLECTNALVLPCDSQHFSASGKNRCLLYVALSRASDTLTLVVSERQKSPLFRI